MLLPAASRTCRLVALGVGWRDVAAWNGCPEAAVKVARVRGAPKVAFGRAAVQYGLEPQRCSYGSAAVELPARTGPPSEVPGRGVAAQTVPVIWAASGVDGCALS
jgi:hypothetical protein